MAIDLGDLPDDVATLKRLLAEAHATHDAELTRAQSELAQARAELTTHRLELEKLKVELARLRRLRFGRSSEKLDAAIAQLELMIEDAETAEAAREAKTPEPPTPSSTPTHSKPVRAALPESLPREEIVHAAPVACPCCGGAMAKLGEDVSEILEFVPATFKVIRHVRPKMSCRTCETIAQAPVPSAPIERGRPGPGLLAHVLVAKFADHLPLYRQSEIFARGGVELPRSTLADWVGRSAWLLEPLVEAIGRHVLAGAAIHADDTPVPVLDPGRGRTKTGRLWAYLRDERPWASQAPPAVIFRYTPDRKGERPRDHLQGYAGFLHADAYAGFDKLYGEAEAPGPITEVACWAHARRGFHDVMVATKAPLAVEAIERIAKFYEIEAEAHGQPPDRRRALRQEKAKPLIDAFHAWLTATLPKLSAKSALAEAIGYALNHWTALTRYLDDGRLAIDNNPVERALRPVALGRKNYLFAGADTGGERAAAIYSTIATAKLNDVEPESYLRDVLARIADHKINRIEELLPWAWAGERAQNEAA